MNNEYILYILMRNDLPSMNAGKAMAQASHASNAFIHNVTKNFTKTDKLKGPIQRAVEEWQSATPQGFGTVIVLSTNMEQLQSIQSELSSDVFFEEIIDPTYPYIVNKEVAQLIDQKHHTVAPIVKNDGSVVLHRKEITCAYVFGTKERCKNIIGHLPLHA